MSRAKLIKILKIIMIIIIVIVAIKLIPYMDPEIVRDWVNQYGQAGIIFFIFLWSVLPIFLFPVPVLALAGGMCFGFVRGSLYSLVGIMINYSVMFLMTRYLAKEPVKVYLNNKLPTTVKKRIYVKDQKALSVFLFLLRFLPVISYNLINYVAGLTEISFKNYFISSFFGILPGLITYLNFGDKILEPTSKDFWIAIALIALVVVSSILISRWYMKKTAYKYEDEEDGEEGSPVDPEGQDKKDDKEEKN